MFKHSLLLVIYVPEKNVFYFALKRIKYFFEFYISNQKCRQVGTKTKIILRKNKKSFVLLYIDQK